MLNLNNKEIELKPLVLEDIELVRQWRNSPLILFHMEFQKVISAEEQLLWFNSLANEKCYYFVIAVNNVKVGLVHLNKLEKNTAHVGLFIGNQNYVGTGVSLGASVLILSFAFEELKLTKLLAKVKSSNNVAISYNESLGFEFSGNLNAEFSEYIITQEKYFEKVNYLKKLAQVNLS